MKFSPNGITKTASFNLPVAFQAAKIPAGTWHAILEIDEALYKRELVALKDKNQQAAGNLRAQGAKYCVSVHSFSNLRMTSAVTQNAYDPGSTFTLRANLTEYGQPIEKRATVSAALEYPDHSHGVLSLAEVEPGVFQTSMTAGMPGIYRFLIQAKGGTYRGVKFTREQVLNAAVYHDIHKTPGKPDGGTTKADLCRLLSCLLDRENLSPSYEEWLKKQGISLAGIRKCVDIFCKG